MVNAHRGVVLPLMLLWLVGFTLLGHGAWAATEARIAARRLEDQAAQARRIGRALLRAATPDSAEHLARALQGAAPGLRLITHDVVLFADRWTLRETRIEYGLARLWVRALLERFDARSWLGSRTGWIEVGWASVLSDPGVVVWADAGPCPDAPDLAAGPILAADGRSVDRHVLPSLLHARLDTLTRLEGGTGVRVSEGSLRLAPERRFEGWLWVERDLVIGAGAILRGGALIGGRLIVEAGGQVEVDPCVALGALDALEGIDRPRPVSQARGFVP